MIEIDNSGKAIILDALPNPITRAIFNYKYNLDMEYKDIVERYNGNNQVVEKSLATINKAIEKYLKLKTCRDCGTKFLTNQRRQLCMECRAKNKKMCLEQQAESHKSVYTHKQTKKCRRKFKSLEEICREIDKYNKEHNTKYSYGQYLVKVGEYNGE